MKTIQQDLNPTTSPWIKQLTWLGIVHSGVWCLRLALRTPSGACQKWRKSDDTKSTKFRMIDRRGNRIWTGVGQRKLLPLLSFACDDITYLVFCIRSPRQWGGQWERRGARSRWTCRPDCLQRSRQPVLRREISPVVFLCHFRRATSQQTWPSSLPNFALFSVCRIIHFPARRRKTGFLVVFPAWLFRYLVIIIFSLLVSTKWLLGVLRRQSHRHSGLATLPSVGAIL